MQRHDVESVASAGASPAASTSSTESKPQQTGTGPLIRLAEVAHFTTRNAEAVSEHFMNHILNKATVLVLNRNWQAINLCTPQNAFSQMATNVATPLSAFFVSFG